MDTDGESRNPIVLVVVLVLVIEAGEIEDEDENENENEDENLRRQPAEAKRGAHGVTRPTTGSKCFLVITLNFLRQRFDRTGFGPTVFLGFAGE